MPVLTCPKCESRYDPGMDEVLGSLDTSAVSLKVVCPVCRQWLRLPENEAIEPPIISPEALAGMLSQSRVIERGKGATQLAKARRREPERKFERKPESERKLDRTPERKSERKRDEEDERPRARRKRLPPPVARKGGVPIWLWIVGAVLLTFCVSASAVTYMAYRAVTESFVYRALFGVSGLTANNLRALKVGMSETEVIALFGKPNEVREQPNERLLFAGPAGPGPVTKRTAIWLGKNGALIVEFHNEVLACAVGEAEQFKHIVGTSGQGGELRVPGMAANYPPVRMAGPGAWLREPLVETIRPTSEPPLVGETTAYAGESPGGQRVWYLPAGQMVIGIGVRTGEFGGAAIAQVIPLTTAMHGHQYQMAPPGYALGGLAIQAREYVLAVRPIFFKVDANGRLDPNNRKVGEWMGFPNQPGSLESQLGADGRRVLGIASREGLILDGLALVMEGAKR